jgi:hypothetical protein
MDPLGLFGELESLPSTSAPAEFVQLSENRYKKPPFYCQNSILQIIPPVNSATQLDATFLVPLIPRIQASVAEEWEANGK